jgi:hypothetical protein
MWHGNLRAEHINIQMRVPNETDVFSTPYIFVCNSGIPLKDSEVGSYFTEAFQY